MSEEKQMTPLAELIEWIDNEILLNPQYKDSPRFVQGAMTVKVKAQSLLPKEKQGIIEAWHNQPYNHTVITGEQYFNSKYNQ